MKTILMIAVLCAALLLPTCASAAPDDRVLIYYGWPSSLNYHVNYWNLNLVAQDMARYDMVVLGQGLEDPTHQDHANTVTIISQIPSTDVYGYMTLNQAESSTISNIDQWDDMGVAGIFIDEAGYDYGTGRAEFNRVIDYIHTRPSANMAFVNAWNPDHVIGTENDVAYPNTVYNPNNSPSSLGSADHYLLESCPIYHNTLWMRGYNIAKCNRCVALRNLYGINLASASTISNGHPNWQSLYAYHVRISTIYGFDAQGTSDLWYGAASSQVRMG